MKLYELLDHVLYEDKSAPLYHFTTLQNFYSILNSNELRGNVRMDALDWSKVDMGAGGITAQAKKTSKIISLTRDPNRTFIPGSAGDGVGFRIDQNKLAQNYKIGPSIHDPEKYTKKKQSGIGSNKESSRLDKFESEERVYTDKITNFRKYITGIVIPTRKKIIKKDDDTGVAIYLLHYSGSLYPRKGRTGNMSYAMRDNKLNAAIKLSLQIIFSRRENDP